MKPDPVLERIRTVRGEISKKCNHNPQELVAHYQEMEEEFKGRILKQASTKTTVPSDKSLSGPRPFKSKIG